ncbi:MAG: metalloprotease PmbA [Lautropia sp.]|nr:metalloprotease PmbA [Lautropia sp.]
MTSRTASKSAAFSRSPAAAVAPRATTARGGLPAAYRKGKGWGKDRALFDYQRSDFEALSAEAMQMARSLGATAVVTEVSESSGLAVTVRKGKVETIEQTRDKGLGVSVYVGRRRGHASTSDFSPAALERTVRAAFDIAAITGEDPFAGLPDLDRLAMGQHDVSSLRLFDPWQIPVEQAIELAREIEAAGFAVSPLVGNSDGASVSVGHGHFLSSNSLGFSGGFPYSRHTLSCGLIARRGRDMQRDGWYSSSRSPAGLASPGALGRYSAERALARLGARKLSTRKVPVLFEAPLALGLLGSLVQATSGSALYRRATFLVDSLGRQIFPDHIDIDEDPFIPGAMGSGPFDDEGVATAARSVVSGGVLEGYFLSSYSARKLGMQTTGNAGGSHNLQLRSRLTKRTDDFARMLKKMGTGLLVTEVMGQGVNYVTGDYSRGASGFWVENGEIQYPVEEITIAGNLADMYRGIVAVGNDVLTRGTKSCGSILIEEMAVAG